MKRVIALITLLLLAASPSLTFAEPPAKPGPEVLIEKLYKEHKGGEGVFFQTKSRAPIDLFFTKDLADKIWKDALASKGEVGAIEFDPLFGAQDAQITQFKINKGAADAKSTDTDKASVEVTFKNEGKKQSIVFALGQDKTNAWKISDIRYPDHTSLREIYAAQPPAKR